ncbi:MAG: transposase [Thermodesulfobacteriota bacterium]|nr:transposase [Thermodesulfobacteriota bacterium]
MPNYKRARCGTTYFFTVVTYQRRKILCLEPCREILRDVIQATRDVYPFAIDAFVLLPEHLHCIWNLPEGDSNYSMRWGLIKKEFTKRAQYVVDKMVGAAHPTDSRKRHREGTIWQRRFWEHRITDQKDFNTHVDYIHYNPVKHGLAIVPIDWEYSSFQRYVNAGIYEREWGAGRNITFDKAIGRE